MASEKTIMTEAEEVFSFFQPGASKPRNMLDTQQLEVALRSLGLRPPSVRRCLPDLLCAHVVSLGAESTSWPVCVGGAARCCRARCGKTNCRQRTCADLPRVVMAFMPCGCSFSPLPTLPFCLVCFADAALRNTSRWQTGTITCAHVRCRQSASSTSTSRARGG
jgi:hypothetical protein